jgi:NDP-sugar pyrophosphorylase family protein
MREKPEFTYMINAGMYILESHLLQEIPEGEFFHITSLISQVKERGGKVGVFPVSEKQYSDIGEWDIYFKTLSLQK